MGFEKASKEELVGGTAEENAKITIDILKGSKGAKRDITIMNSAAALITGDHANGFMEAAGLAAEAIDSGAAMKKLEEIIKTTNTV